VQEAILKRLGKISKIGKDRIELLVKAVTLWNLASQTNPGVTKCEQRRHFARQE
jgi:hypothetical protein